MFTCLNWFHTICTKTFCDLKFVDVYKVMGMNQLAQNRAVERIKVWIAQLKP